MKHKILTGLIGLGLVLGTALFQEYKEIKRLQSDYQGRLLGSDRKLTSGELTDLMDTLGTVKVASCYKNPGVANMIKYLQAKGITNRYQMVYIE